MIRSRWSPAASCWKPRPSTPSRFSAGTGHSSKRELGGVGGAHAHLVELPAHREAREAALDEEHRDAVVPALGGAVAGARGDEVEIAVDAVGDEGLASGEEIVVAVPHRARRQRRHVGPGAGLGDAERAHRLALDDAGQVLLLLRLGAVAREPGRRHVRVHEHAERHAARPAPRHLLAEHDARQEVAAAATVLDRELEAEQTQLAEPPPERARDPPRFLPGVDVRRDFLVHEGADASAAASRARRRRCRCSWAGLRSIQDGGSLYSTGTRWQVRRYTWPPRARKGPLRSDR